MKHMHRVHLGYREHPTPIWPRQAKGATVHSCILQALHDILVMQDLVQASLIEPGDTLNPL
jgi:hypothetical protein